MQDALSSISSQKPAKDRIYGILFLALFLLINPLTFLWLESLEIIPPISNFYRHRNDIILYLPLILDVFILISAGLAFFASKPFLSYPQKSAPFNSLMLSIALGILLFTNPILTGRFLLLRLIWVLFCLYLALRSFYLGVVKQEKTRFKNLKTLGFALLAILLLAEGAFMFIARTHHFNGTLASRNWFMRHWSLNEMGYRDAPYDSENLKGKKKIMVLGDSFVAGHGIKEEKDRFSNLLQEKLDPDQYHVFNLGLQGSDVKDAIRRIREFPYAPDLLVFVHYPNDIEDTGEEAGLELKLAQSFKDLNFLPRFFVRRSHLLNYLYWAYPHPSDLFDYKGFLKQCYTHPKVIAQHYKDLDSLLLPIREREVPVLMVAFPFLEEVKESKPFLEPIYTYARNRRFPILKVEDLVAGKAVEDLIVNQNDAHANEAVNIWVGDAILEAIQEMNFLMERNSGP